MSPILAGFLTAAALFLWWRPQHRAPHLRGGRAVGRKSTRPSRDREDRLPARVIRATSGAAAGSTWLLVGGLFGAMAGVVVGIGLLLVLANLETSAARLRRRQLVRDSPLVAELLSAALAAGVPIERCLLTVATAVGGPCSDALLEVHRRAALGEPSGRAWRPVMPLPGLGKVAATVSRSGRTGAPVADLLAQTAQDLRIEARSHITSEIRAASVKAVLPLGLCLLPAFMLLGVAPVVGGLLGGEMSAPLSTP